MKKLMYACMAIIALGNIAMAEEEFTLPAVPKKLQGAWICSGGGSPMTIGTNTVKFGSDELKLISIKPGGEDLTTVIVKWLPSPRALVAVAVWSLIKLNGQEFLMDINYESPTSHQLCFRGRGHARPRPKR